MEVNRLLKDQGFLYGKPGAYGLTSKGEEYGSQRDYDNGHSGTYHVAYSTTLFDPSIMEVIDLSPEKLAEVRADIRADRQARQAEKTAAQAHYEANYQASRSAKEKAKGQEEHDELIEWLIAGGVVALIGTVIAAKKGIAWYKHRKSEKAENAKAAEDGCGASSDVHEK
ncbi:hypothetical protein [Arthrobacter sedimenti]|uniref:Uncharacterized protein n=1 Tax=Arthrobacter sedimenti TaxID=2694931 RepID=A0ABV8WGM6_9MICC